MRIGSLCSGYGGLEMGIQAVYGGTTAWVSDVDRGACKILAHRYPDVPNVGDMTKVDWTQVEPVDVICGGTPCQDLSHAGRRAGMTEGTRSNLWVAMREAIATIRPRLVVWENVRGAYSAKADSDLELCPGCMGDDRGQPVLRALGRVLGDLSDLGYDASWHGLRAADVGAPHGRMRVFVLATDTDGRVDLPGGARADQWAVPVGDGRGSTGALLPTPRVGGLGDNPSERRRNSPGLEVVVNDLLPTPRATDGTKGGPNQRGSSGDRMLPSAVAGLLLPTPERSDGSGGRKSAELGGFRESGAKRAITLATAVDHAQWGDYAAAIARWEHTLGRPAPEPTQTSTKGNPQLSPRFVEWMMGLPAGWVTDVPGITRNEALKALGNGVVPQQAAEALRVMAGWSVAA